MLDKKSAGVCADRSLSTLDKKSMGVRPDRSLKVEDMDEFPTLGLMERLAKIEKDKADKETFSLKQRLAALRKSGLY